MSLLTIPMVTVDYSSEDSSGFGLWVLNYVDISLTAGGITVNYYWS